MLRLRKLLNVDVVYIEVQDFQICDLNCQQSGKSINNLVDFLNCYFFVS